MLILKELRQPAFLRLSPKFQERPMRTIRYLGMLCFAAAALSVPATCSAEAGIAASVSITVAPPVLPVYVQPACPAPGYLWTPGYWAWGADGYFWVPGTWVQPPTVGLLWTPGYWGWVGGFYVWHVGYWGPHIGFYGGVNYGFGYGGVGFAGGYWHGGVFMYNRAVTNINVNVIHQTNIYSKTVVNNTTVSRVSYNGGAGGLTARPTAAEMAAARERHVDATQAQRQHEHLASTNHAMLASVNHGRPETAATAHPGEFSAHGENSASHPSGHNSNEGSKGNSNKGKSGSKEKEDQGKGRDGRGFSR
jgi:WXXGXW repeat (2 copies)